MYAYLSLDYDKLLFSVLFIFEVCCYLAASDFNNRSKFISFLRHDKVKQCHEEAFVSLLAVFVFVNDFTRLKPFLKNGKQKLSGSVQLFSTGGYVCKMQTTGQSWIFGVIKSFCELYKC